MRNIIEKILIVLMMTLFFFIGAFAAKIVYPAELPQDMEFLSKIPVFAEGDCTQKATQKHFFCDYRIDLETGNSYLVVWNETELYEVVRSDMSGNIETIYRTAKKLRL